MSLYERFKDEAEFREKFVKLLLNRLGYYGVSEQHGTQEFGKDFVFSELHRLGGMRHYAAQVKHAKRINQGTSVDELLSQVRQAFARPFKRTDSPRECHVSAVYVFNSGEITANAKEQLLRELEQERYGDNVHFLDGERLEALNEWATLQSDANVRARLLGLRTALRVIIFDLETKHLQERELLRPSFVIGIELYLSEPVNCDDKLLGSLIGLWNLLQGIAGFRKLVVPKSKNAKEFLPMIRKLAEDALPLAIECSQQVDAAIEKMKPLGES
jgi:Restriction endonuclease